MKTKLSIKFKSWKILIESLVQKDWKRVEQTIRGTRIGNIVYASCFSSVRRFIKNNLKPKKRIPLPILEKKIIRIEKNFDLSGLKFPIFDAIEVSIIIPCYGNISHTAACLKSIVNNFPITAIEVIVVDDCSPDKEIDNLQYVPGLIYRKNTQNMGFLRSCNQAVSLARGKYICLLNNDTQVTTGWLDALCDVFKQKNDAGLVGSKLLYPDGHLQEAGGIIWNDGNGHNYGKMDNPLLPQYNYIKRVDYVSGAAIMIPRALWSSLNGFDEHFAPAYCEDSDFCFRVRAIGKQVYLQPASVVIHFEGISHGKNILGGTKKYQKINQEKLFNRWEKILRKDHFPPGNNIFFARDRAKSFRHTVLIVETDILRADQDAGSRTIFDIIKILLEYNCNIKFWPDTLVFDPIYTPILQQMGVETFYGSYMNFAQWIEENGNYIDVAFVCRPNISERYIELLRKYSKALVLYYGHDIHYLRMQQQLCLADELIENNKEMLRLRETEQRIWSKTDAVIYPSNEEASHVSSFMKKHEISAKAVSIPAWFYSSTHYINTDALSLRRDILFVAGFDHAPNIDAACWMVHDILPLVRKQFPEVHLHLVGNKPTRKVESLACEYIHVTGWVSDTVLSYYYSRCRVAVSPLRFGAGVKRKIVESMHHGLPIVTTSVGIQGLAAVSDFLPYSDDEEVIAENVITLLSDDAYWRNISRQSIDFINKNYSSDAMKHAVISLLPSSEKVLEKNP